MFAGMANPSFFRRSLSIANPLIVKDSMMAVAPFPELRGSFGIDLVATAIMAGEVVVFGLVNFAVCGSYSKI